MYSRMQALEQETTKSRQRMLELEAELKKAKSAAATVQRDGQPERGQQGGEWEARAHKLEEQKQGASSAKAEPLCSFSDLLFRLCPTDLEMLVSLLKQNLKMIQRDWEAEMTEVAALRRQLQKQAADAEGKRSQSSSRLQNLYDEAIERIQRLEEEVKKLKGTVLEALEVRRAAKDAVAPGQVSQSQARYATPAYNRHVQRPTRYDVGVQTVAQRGEAPDGVSIRDSQPTKNLKATERVDNHNRQPQQPTSAASEAAESPFPSIRGEDLERDFFSPARKVSARHRPPHATRRTESVKEKSVQERAREVEDALSTAGERLPPQTLVISVLSEIEDDYQHYLK